MLLLYLLLLAEVLEIFFLCTELSIPSHGNCASVTTLIITQIFQMGFFFQILAQKNLPRLKEVT